MLPVRAGKRQRCCGRRFERSENLLKGGQVTPPYELNNRRENEDFRRQLWSKQLELLGKINVNFQKNRSEEIDKILAISPFTDE